MGYPNKGSRYRDLQNHTLTAKTDGDKLELFTEQLKSMFVQLKLILRTRI